MAAKGPLPGYLRPVESAQTRRTMGESEAREPDTMPPYSVPRRLAATNEDQVPLNWRRGMFRIWLVLSAAWIMGWIIEFLVYGIQGGFRIWSDFLAVPILLFGPPVALLIFGIAVGWAFRGFLPNAAKSETSE
jgi:hypothetical protein